jgi:imidazolonepropionase-like amidohydrolase
MIRYTLLLAAASLALAAAPPVVVRNATVLTVTKGTFQGSVLIRDGKIVELGEKVQAPAGAEIIDAGGQYVMPGIIDPHSHIGAEGVNEGSISVSSMVDIHDVIDPRAIGIYRALAGGVTSVCVLHGSANAIGGLSAVIKTRWGQDARGLLLHGAKPILKMALGENVKRAGTALALYGDAQPSPRYPATRMGTEDVIREAFTEARTYQKAWKDYEARRTRGESPLAPRRDLKLEPLVAVLEGKCLVHAHCYRADEILMLLKLSKEFDFKIAALIHVLEGYKVAKEIAAHGAGATTFSDWWGYKVEAADAIPFNAALMTGKGVLVSLNSDDPELMRHLNTEAAKTIKYGGLTEEEALATITINPAKQLGLEARIGSIEPGKDADLVIFDQHPLSNFAKVRKVLIDGRVYFDRDRDMSERAERDSRKKTLLDKAKQREAEQKKTSPRRPQ